MKAKKMSALILCIAMILMQLPVNDFIVKANETILYEEDFQYNEALGKNYVAGDTPTEWVYSPGISPNLDGKGDIQLEAAGSSNNVYRTVRNGTQIGTASSTFTLDPIVSGNRLNIDYRFRISSLNVQNFFMIKNNAGNTVFSLGNDRYTHNGKFLYSTSKVANITPDVTIAVNTWYDVKILLDFDSQRIYAKVYDTAGNLLFEINEACVIDSVKTIVANVYNRYPNIGHYMDLDNVVIKTLPSNNAPQVIEAISDKTVNFEESISFSLNGIFADADNEAITYSATLGTIDPTTNMYSYTPSAVGTETETITATDIWGAKTTTQFNIITKSTVVNTPPVVSNPIGNQEIIAGETLVINLDQIFSDEDQDPLVFTSELHTSKIDNSVYTFKVFTLGTYTETITANDSKGGVVTETFDIVVINADESILYQQDFQEFNINDTPTGWIHEVGTNSSISQIASVIAEDSENKVLKIQRQSTNRGTSGATYELDKAITSGRVKINYRYKITNTVVTNLFTLRNSSGETVFQFGNNRNVVNPPVAGRFTYQVGSTPGVLTDTVISGNTWYTVEMIFDLDMQRAYVKVYNLDGALILDTNVACPISSIKAFNGFIYHNAATINDIQLDDILIKQMPSNIMPVVSGTIENKMTNHQSPFTIDLSNMFMDGDGETLTLSAIYGTINTDTKLYTFTADTVGIFNEVITATDPWGAKASISFQIRVKSLINQAPQIILPIEKQAVAMTEELTIPIIPSFTDPDGDELTYSIVSGEGSISNGKYVFISGTLGSQTVILRATDPEGLYVDLEFIVVVTNRPKVKQQLDTQKLLLGQSYTVDLNTLFQEPDGEAMTFAANLGTVTDSMYIYTPTTSGITLIEITAADIHGLTKKMNFAVLCEEEYTAPSGEDIILDEPFDYATGEKPLGWTENLPFFDVGKGHAVYRVDENGAYELDFKTIATSGYTTPETSIKLNAMTPNEFTFTGKFCNQMNPDGIYKNFAQTIYILDQRDKTILKLNLGAGNTPLVSYETNVQANTVHSNAILTEGVWYSFTIKVNPVTKKIDIKITGDQTYTFNDIPYNPDLVYAAMVKVTGSSYNNGTRVTSYKSLIDDFKIITDLTENPDDLAKAKMDASELTYSSITREDRNYVTRRISLPTEGSYGSIITWEISDTSVITPDGFVMRPPIGSGDKTILLNATIQMGTSYIKKQFILNVVEAIDWQYKVQHYSDFESHERDQIAEDWQFGFGYTKHDDTNRFVVADPENPNNQVLMLRNHTFSPQTYRGVQTSKFFGTAYNGEVVTELRYRMDSSKVWENQISFKNAKGERLFSVGNSGTAFKYNGIDNETVILNNIPFKANEWYDLKIVFNTFTASVSFYINGELAANFEPAYNVSNNYAIGEINLYGWLPPGANMTGKFYIDDLKVSQNVTMLLEDALGEFSLDQYNNPYTEGITNSFQLPVVGRHGSQIAWESSDPSILSFDENGNVLLNRGVTDKNIIVKAIATLEGVQEYRNFNVKVTREFTDEDSVNYAKAVFNLQEYTEEYLSRLEKDFTVTIEDIEGASITLSSNNNGIQIEGSELKITPTGQDLSGTVVATFRKGNAVAEKVFNTIVLKSFVNNNLLLNTTVNNHSTFLGVYVPSNAIDGNYSTSWKTSYYDKNPSLTVDLGTVKTFDSVVLSEYYDKSPLVGGYKLEVSKDRQQWTTVYNGTTLAELQNYIRFSMVNARYIRYTVTSKLPGVSGLNEIRVFLVDYTDAEAVREALKFITLPPTTTENLTLPLIGEFGTKLSWSSSDGNVISNTGIVTRQSTNKTVTLTVTACKGNESATKAFPITVPPISQSPGGGGPSGGGQIIGGGGGSSGGSPIIGMPEPTVPTTPKFPDVPLERWSNQYVEELAKRGIISGNQNGQFEPQRPITREEFLKMLLLSLNIQITGVETRFKDVEKGAWYHDYISTAASLGIVSGISSVEFGVGKNITRQDMAVMTTKAIAKVRKNFNIVNEKTTFIDSSEFADYSASSILLLQQYSIINGFEDKSFRPLNHTSREEAATVIFKIL